MEEKLKRLAIDIPASLHKQLKTRAAEKEISLRDLVLSYLKDLLGKYSDQEIKIKPYKGKPG